MQREPETRKDILMFPQGDLSVAQRTEGERTPLPHLMEECYSRREEGQKGWATVVMGDGALPVCPRLGIMGGNYNYVSKATFHSRDL